jgi:hypothetical protein
MTKITLSSNASGTGNVNFAAPNTNSAITVTLPTSNVDMDSLGPSTTAGAVGTYAFLSEINNGQPDRDFGDTLAGSGLRLSSASTYASYIWNNTNIAVSGTWRLMGDYPLHSYQRNNTASVWVRIS